MGSARRQILLALSFGVVPALVGAAPAGKSPWSVNVVSSELRKAWTDKPGRVFSVKADPGSSLAIVTVEVTALVGVSGQLAARLAPHAKELGPDATTFLSGSMPEAWQKVNVMQLFAFPKDMAGPSQLFLSSKCPLKLGSASQSLPVAVGAKDSVVLSLIQAPSFIDTSEPGMLLYRQERLAAGWVYVNRKVELTLVYSVPENTRAGTLSFGDAAPKALVFSSPEASAGPRSGTTP